MNLIKTFLTKPVLFFIFLFNTCLVSGQTIWSIGPMLHVNIGGEKVKVSYALELAYWNFSHFPYSVDFGMEFERKRIRLYSEAQTGIGVAGIAAGPVIEIQTDKPAVRFGFQGSVWANYYLGFDFRFRYIDKKKLYCPGIYVKAPFYARDENGEKIKSSSSRSGFDD
ncbi:hypothetical protein CNR22_23110 [Sphingobacteriaceae bacterium]|nr:hypothetical protein CNR22_23110 [Sphingobacteriaceae bacterium]